MVVGKPTLDISVNTSSNASPQTMGARERILNAAYQLFSQHGIQRVGVDTIIAASGVAKMSLYKHFRSKEELVLAFLEMRESLWTRQWLEATIMETGKTADSRLLAIFDVFDEWFQKPDFEGCSFINVLLESVPGSPVHQSAADQLAKIRSILSAQAREAGLCEPEKFAQIWHFLMKGCIVTANEGNRKAAQQAKEAGVILLQNWSRIRI